MVVGDIVPERFAEAVIFLVDNGIDQKEPSEDGGEKSSKQKVHIVQRPRGRKEPMWLMLHEGEGDGRI